MSYETAVHCDGCGDTLYFLNIIPKWLIISKARESGWSMGKYHLCHECRKNRNKLKKEGWLR